MDELSECIQQVKYDGSEDDVLGHRAIFTHVESQFINSPKRRHECPPLNVILYAARNIMLPAINMPQIPDLLDLVTIVEYHRQEAHSKVGEALTFNAHWRSMGEPEEDLLNEEEEDFMEALMVEDGDMRESYLAVIQGLIQLDVHHLWTSEAPSIAKLAVRMNEYFPPTNEKYRREPSLLFHSDLNEEERMLIEGLGRNTMVVMKQTLDWAVSRIAPGQSIASVFQSEEFAQVGRPDAIDTGIPSSLEWLERVEQNIQKLEVIFTAYPHLVSS
ncbi:hypothetical protein ONZ45_g8899 [Pleurotus djamor]|nr:hypothetical protein ONZ45_g8899 [Pleurotus djamor]